MNKTIYPAADGEATSMAVVRALSIATDNQPENLQPLHESIDTDSLDRLFDGRPFGRVVFEHMDYRIVVDGLGKIEIIDVCESE